MPIETKTEGRGIPARKRVTIKGPFGSDEAEAVLALFKGREFTFDGLYGRVAEQRALAVLSEAGPDISPDRFEHGSKESYAARMLDKLRLVRGMIERGHAAEAARFACELGALMREAEIEGVWGKDAVRGRSNAETLRRSAASHNRVRGSKATAEHERWQAEARKVLADKPNLTRSAVARIVKHRLQLTQSERTIRRKLATLT